MATNQIVLNNEDFAADADAGTRVIVAICVASFFAVINFIATSPFYPKMARELDTSVSRLGQVITIMVFISAVLGLAVGPLSDRFGYRRPLIFGMLAIAFNLIGAGLTPSFLPLLGLSVVGGLGDALVFGMPMAIAGSRFSGQAQKKAISWAWGSMSIAGIVAVPLLSLVGGSAGWRVALIASGIGTLVGVWFVAISLPPDKLTSRKAIQVSELIESYLPIFKHPPILRLFGVTFMRAACWIGLLTYLGSFLQDELGLSVRQASFFYTVGGGGFAIGSFAAGREIRGVSPRRIVALASAIAGLAVGALFITAVVWATMPLLLIIAFVSAISGVAIVQLLAVESQAGSGTTMVLNGSVLNLGTAAGAAVGGALIALGGYTALGIGFPLFAFAGAALASWPAGARGDAANLHVESKNVAATN